MIRVYGPGGPYEAVKECCGVYAARTGIQVAVKKGRPDLLAAEAKAEGDIVYSGAPSMLEDLRRAFPGTVEESTVRYPVTRRIGIIVRRGNPRGIRSLDGLAAEGIRLMDVRLERMDEFFDALPGIRANIAETVVTGEEGFEKWTTRPALDAWITYRTWHVQLRDGSGFVVWGGGEGTCRATPLALTATTRQREEALRLLEFLSGSEARSIFQKWGWE